MARFEQQRTLGGIANPNQPRAQAALTLADQLQGFGKMAASVYRQERLESAQEEAMAVEPGAETPEYRSGLTETGRVFNEVVRAGHVASVKNDYTRRIGEMAIEFENDPEAFQSGLQAYRSSMLNQVDPEIRNQVALDYDQATIRPLLASKERFQAARTNESIIEITSSIDTFAQDAAKAARDGDLDVVAYNETAIQEAAETLRGLGRPDLAAKVVDGMQQSIDKQIALGQAEDAIQQGRGREFIKEFIDNPPEDLTPQQVDSYAATMTAMNSRYQSLTAQESLKLSVDQKREVSNLKILASTGSGDPEVIMARADQMFNAGWIGEEERTSIFSKLLKTDAKAVKEAKDLQAVADRLAGNDMVSVDDEAVDKYYTDVLVPEMQQDPLTAQEKQVNYITQMKSVPKTLRRQLQTFVMSDDPELIQSAAMLVDKVDQIPGLVDSVFKPNQQAFMDQVLLLSENLDPSEAVRLARQNTNPDDVARIEARTSELKEMKKGFTAIDYKSEAADAFTQWFGGPDVDDIVADRMGREYGALFEAYYKAGNTEEQAKDNAAKNLKRNWSEWQGRVMKYSPDNYYQVAGSSDYVMDQLHADVNKEFYFETPVKKSQLVLISSEETARGASKGKPGYRIAVVEDGGLNILPAPGLWVPDVEKQKRKVERKHQKQMEEGSKPQTVTVAGEEVFYSK